MKSTCFGVAVLSREFSFKEIVLISVFDAVIYYLSMYSVHFTDSEKYNCFRINLLIMNAMFP